VTRHSIFARIALALAVLGVGCAQNDVGVVEWNVSRAVRLARATAIRDECRAQGITDGALMVAMLAEEETHLSHCASEFRACSGPNSPDCGGAAILSGGGDGACSLDRGGLGMFQIDDGTEADTVRVHGAGVLTLTGNTRAAIDRIIQKLIASAYLSISTRAEAIAFLNNLRIDDASYRSYINTVVRYWNGCPMSGACWANRYPLYDAAPRTLLAEMGRDFWYGGTTPPPTGTGWISSPIDAPRVTSYVTQTSGGRLVRYDCTAISRSGHRGTDFGVAIGTPVYAAAAGTVIRSRTGCANDGSLTNSCGSGYGNHVIILHAGGNATLYAHLSPDGTQIRNGATVDCGQLIGHSGHSGRSSGPHLHFEVRTRVTNESTYFVADNTLDPYGGMCSSQVAPLWTTGNMPTRSCMPTGGDNSALVSATYPREVAGTPGMMLTQRFRWRNTGTTTWTTADYVMRHEGGAFGTPREHTLPAGTMLMPGGQIDIDVPVTVPTASGLHRGTWRMARRTGALFGAQGILEVRVPAMPRSCRSSTLGRDVPNGDCVQVSYPGCAMSRCAWYRCADGSWTCTEMSACTGMQYPAAACVTMPDAGVDGNMCQNGGAPNGESCTSAADCCEGLECSQDGVGERTCCAGSATRCSSHAQCCGSMLCSSGFCACVPEGQLCLNDSDCCDTLACVSGACRDCGSLGGTTASCATRSDCCYPLNCQMSAGGGASQCCVSGGNRCQSDADCCGDMNCVTGRCACRGRGESCTNLLDCCGALLCNGGVCGG
jgi:murein DD-endopeptidase MepM/ murein hydrolase activator NlpD